MTVREFSSATAFLVSLMLLLSFVESMMPLFTRRTGNTRRTVTNLGFMTSTFLLNWALSSAAALASILLASHAAGPSRWPLLPLPARVAVAVVVLDFATYLAHVSMHKIPLLWRFHRIHHSDAFVDVTTTFRQHPVEGAWRYLWILVPVWMLGLPAPGIALHRILSAGNALLEHSNVCMWTKADSNFSLLWCTPNMHKVHHSQNPQQTDSNYGNILSVFDRSFHTFRSTREAGSVLYGLDDAAAESEESFSGLMTLPFARPQVNQPMTGN